MYTPRVLALLLAVLRPRAEFCLLRFYHSARETLRPRGVDPERPKASDALVSGASRLGVERLDWSSADCVWAIWATFRGSLNGGMADVDTRAILAYTMLECSKRRHVGRILSCSTRHDASWKPEEVTRLVRLLSGLQSLSCDPILPTFARNSVSKYEVVVPNHHLQ